MSFTRLAALIAVSAFGMVSLAQTEKTAPEGELLVKTRSLRISPILRQALGATVEPAIPELNVVKIKFKNRTNLQAIEMLRRDSSVMYAEPNYRRYWQFVPNDPRLGEQYGMPQIGAPAAWDIFKGNSNTVIGVLDSGLNTNHEDIVGRVVLTRNTELDNNDMTDNVGHGTHCMGIAAATTNNGRGVASVAFNPKLIAVKLGDLPGADASAKGLVFAANNGAKIISMSYGRGIRSQVEADAVAYAWGRGALLFAAAGNDGSNSDTDIGFPALLPNVVVVAATDATDGRASFSNFGSKVQIAAPGDEILSLGTASNSSYVTMGGTSMACPYAASAAALVWGRNPALRNTEVRDILFNTADPKSFVTQGRINIAKAILKAVLPAYSSGSLLTQIAAVNGITEGSLVTPFGSISAAAASTNATDTNKFVVRSAFNPKQGGLASVETIVRVTTPLVAVKSAKLDVVSTAPLPVSSMVYLFNFSSGQFELIGTIGNSATEKANSFTLDTTTMGRYMNISGHMRVLVRSVSPVRAGQTPWNIEFNRIAITGTFDSTLLP